MRKTLPMFALCLLVLPVAHAKDAPLDFQSLQGRSVESIVATTGKPEFFFEDSVLSKFPVGSLFNMMGENKGLRKGEEIARQFGIPDPALRISSEVATAISARSTSPT